MSSKIIWCCLYVGTVRCIPGDLVIVLLPHSHCSDAPLSRGGIAGASTTTHGRREGVIINRICEDMETHAQNIWVITSKALATGIVCLASDWLIRSDMMFSEDPPRGPCFDRSLLWDLWEMYYNRTMQTYVSVCSNTRCVKVQILTLSQRTDKQKRQSHESEHLYE